MSGFPFMPDHSGQPADAFADGVIDDEEASAAARTLSVARQVASQAGRELRAHQMQDQQKQKNPAEEVVRDSGDQHVSEDEENVVVDKPAAKKPAAKKATSKKAKK